MSRATPLPDGRRGQALAVAMLCGVLLLAVAGGVLPAIAWFQDRQARLEDSQTLANRMAALAATAPALQRAAEAAAEAEAKGGPVRGASFEAASETIATALLQQRLGDLAAQAGATVTSAEALPAEAAEPLRRIGVRLAVSGPWPVLVRLLTAIDRAAPRMLAGDLQIHNAASAGAGSLQALDCGVVVTAFYDPAAAK